MGTLSRRFAKVLLLSLCLSAAVVSTALAGQDPEFSARAPGRAWASALSTPVYVDIRARQPVEARIAVSARNYEESMVTKTVRVPANSTARVELSMPVNGSMQVECVGGGARFEEYISANHSYNIGVLQEGPVMLACVNSVLLREIGQLDDDEKDTRLESDTIALDDLPSLWQSYAGFVGMLVMDGDDAGSLRPGQRDAMTRWLRWQGGKIWLVGPKAGAAARELGVDTGGAPGVTVGEAKGYAAGNGLLFIQEKANAVELAKGSVTASTENPLAGFFPSGSYYYSTPGTRLLQGLGGVSVTAIVIALIVFGVAMGPFNYWYIRRRKNYFLLFITTPIIAALGTASIFAASMLSEGFGGRYNQFALMAVRGNGEDAMLFDARGVRSGFFAAKPRFSDNTLVLPLKNHSDRKQLQLDTTDGVVLAGGWLAPRFPSGYITATPVVGRMRLRLEEENGEFFVQNDLGYAVQEVFSRLPDGACGAAGAIAPGSRTKLYRENNIRRLREAEGEINDFLERAKPFGTVAMVARCRGLPYMDDGGLSAAPVSTRFFYCEVGDMTAEDMR